jgi:hypothetical protein
MQLPGLRIGTTVDPSIVHLTARQFVDDPGYVDDGYVSFWYTRVSSLRSHSIIDMS